MTTNCNPALLPTDVQVTVHPLVLFAIVDHHTRRQEAEGRVIGTLLGRRDGNQIEITNCFAVPHAERGDEVAIGKDFNKQMLALHNTSKEVVVGWYASCTTPSTSTEDADTTTDKSNATTTSSSSSSTNNALVADTSSLIHDFYATETEDADPIHLVVDTRLVEDALLVKAYTSSPVVIGGEPMANLFHEVKVKMETTEAEAICLHEMNKTQSENEKKENSDTTPATTTTTTLLQLSLTRLLSLLETTCNYVDQVVENGTKSTSDDATLLESHGREISDALSCVPRLYDFESSVLEQNLQDLLMVTYLSNITKTQLEMAEKLTSTLGL